MNKEKGPSRFLFLYTMTIITVYETTLKWFIYTQVTGNYSALLQTKKKLTVF